MTPTSNPAFVAWSRSPVAPVGGALSQMEVHGLAAPVLRTLLERTGLSAAAVDAVVLGNALGAGGNPARMLALAAGLDDRCAAHSVDSQCCSGLDSVALAVGLLHSGQAEIVIAGGAEAWSRAPLRQTRPRHAGEQPQPYERPAFAPDPERDPDLLQAAADYALCHGHTRDRQQAHARQSHARALAHQAVLGQEITAIAGLAHDAYPRALEPRRMARMPLVARSGAGEAGDVLDAHGLSTPCISPKADGAALVLLATPAACARHGLRPQAYWLASASAGHRPEMPLQAAALAAGQVLARGASALNRHTLTASELQAIELHDAFAVQALDFAQALGLAPEDINLQGGGLARGHPIAASGAIALVRMLSQLRDAPAGALGLAAIAGAGGIGAACLAQRAA
ncbi:thiolase family protein [Comamonas composti]|uniref:thiolase family protein n=1 Tax=Comamonas composti TaxID=408558 RepID=UPI00047D11FD|nr:thiolase family protein [Comamonas composti]